MLERKSSYQGILKATTLFGSVQVLGILVSVLRSKAISMLVGASGMGISGLLLSALNLISAASGLGLETSGVRELAMHEDDSPSKPKAIVLVRYVGKITAVASALLTIAFSPLLSFFAFGIYDHWMWFCLLGIALLFKQLSTAELAILQGFRKYRQLAQANLYGSIVGFVLSIPLFLYFGLDGVAISLVANTLATFGFAHLIAKKQVESPKPGFGKKEAFPLMKLGFFLSVTAIISNLSAYLIQIFVSHSGGLEQAGFYGAGIAILNTYVGILFTAMATDYFPRLSSQVDDVAKMRESVSSQAEIGLLVIMPLVVVFLAFCPVIVRILYTREFLVIVPYLSLGILGMLFRMVSWSMGYMILAKGESKLFLKTSIGFNAIFLLLNCAGYYWYGLAGIGAAFAVHYVIHTVGLAVICAKKYTFVFEREFFALLGICTVLCGISYAATFLAEGQKIIVFALLIPISVAYAFIRLQKKADILSFFRRNKT